MALIKSLPNGTPIFGKNCFLAENATIIGDVKIGDNCSIWFQAVIRGDVNSILIGNEVNIQDGAIIHCTYKKSATMIGDRSSIGHKAIIHGCTISEDVLVGMGAIIMDDVYVPPLTMVAAGATIPPGRKLESGFIYAGSPAKKLRKLTDEEVEFFIHRTARNYQKYASWY